VLENWEGHCMSEVQRNKEVIRRLIEEFVNTGEVSRLHELVSPECIETDGKVRIRSGLKGMAEHILAVRKVYPDLCVSIGQQVAEGEWVATQITACATHSGEWLGIAPTGKRLVFTGINFDRFVDGRLVEHGGAANMLETLLEAGAVRPVTCAERH
jgi:predicted ester cyclase